MEIWLEHGGTPVSQSASRRSHGLLIHGGQVESRFLFDLVSPLVLEKAPVPFRPGLATWSGPGRFSGSAVATA